MSEVFEDESVRAATETSTIVPKPEEPHFFEGTLEEPVMDTIKRDLRTIGRKIRHVMMPYESQQETLQELRDWDLWGPLVIGLALAILLSAGNNDQAAILFSLVFVLIWAGAAVVTLNAALLGGHLSFWQSVCVLGYSVFPLVVARVIGLLLNLSSLSLGSRHLIRLLIVIPALVWATKVSVVFIGEAIDEKRRALATYPVLFFYLSLAWMVIVVP